MGKTMFAESLFRHPFVHKSNAVWRGYSPALHDGIILDDFVNISEYIMANKPLFQGSCKQFPVQTSPTNFAMLQLDVVCKPVVVCCNSLEFNSWIESNSVTLHVSEPLYDDA